MEPFVVQRSTLPFRGEEPKFQEWLQKLEVAASKIQPLYSFDLNNLERPKGELKRISWDNLISPRDAKIASVLLFNFFGLAWTTKW